MHTQFITHLQSIEQSFKSNIENVYRLADFDKAILDLTIGELHLLEKRLDKQHFIDNPKLTAASTRKVLENIRTNESLRPRFEIINNQCVVLLVSFFASAIGDLYRYSIRVLALSRQCQKLNDEEIKFTIGEIINEDADLRERIGRLMEEKKDVSFQDMKSIGRAFGEFFEVKIDKDEIVNNIIMAQAGRHVIVHEGASINDRLLKQVKNAQPRALFKNIPLTGQLLFQQADLKIIGDSMLDYFCELRDQVIQKFKTCDLSCLDENP